MNTQKRTSVWAKKAGIALAGLSCALMGLSVQAATSFPDYPLLTGGAGVPPNILLILDDSGSMGFVKMPEDVSSPDDSTYCSNGFGSSYSGGWRCGLNDNPTDRSFLNNTIYYNPARTYLPWRTSSVDLTARLTNADITAVATNVTALTGSRNLAGNSDAIFYVPKTGVTASTNTSDFDKYRIAASSSSTSWNGAVVQKWGSATSNNGTIPAGIAKNNYSSCIAVTTGSAGSVTIAVAGGGSKVDLYVYSDSACASGSLGSNTSNSDPKTVTVSSPPATIYFNVKNTGNSASPQISWSSAIPASWYDMTTSGVNTSAAQQAELQNFANWYQYARTRNKAAKAGASEAFGKLGSGYRVGFDTIWNRSNGSTIGLSGSVPAYPIPYATSDGAFSGTNRDGFYSALQAAGASDGTPLHGALQRAARYFATDNPWKDSSGNMLSCRQNYAILTTDGYWNDKSSSSGYTSPVGNADLGSTYGDSYSNTLADVAYYYWKNDMRTDMDDNVRASSSDPATWQHMVTFGVSIGQQGTLNPNNPPPSPWNVDPISNSGAQRIDDLWHASLNGHGRFVVAADVDSFANALASALSAIDARTASGSNATTTSTQTNSSTLTFLAGYTSSTWIGDMKANPYNSSFTGVSNLSLWTLSNTFTTGGVNASTATPFSGRTVLTTWGGTVQNFSTAMANTSVFARTVGTDAVSAADNINYILGNQSKEVGQTNGVLRRRAYPIGDITDSAPAYVADTNTVYIGANDGMLHGLDAGTGKVLFSYVPAGLDFSQLSTLSSTSYVHHYFVDGQIDVSPTSVTPSKNILIGALGRGGKGVFSLDVSTPTSMGTGNVLWDKTFKAGDATGDPDMGYVLGAVAIRKGNGGKTYAFVPNGIESTNGSAVLFVYDINANGTVNSVTKLDTGAVGGNGLMSMGLVDLDGNHTIDTVYGADLKGNIWKWDFSGTSLPTAATKIFQATDASGTPQPITGGLDAARDTNGRIFVGFGTGRYISLADVPGNVLYSAQTQSLYGIIDNGATLGRADLQVRTIPYSGASATGQAARGFENYSALPAGKNGWVVDLTGPNNERVISAPTISGSGMYITSVIPGSGGGCSGAQGSGYLNAIDIFTGTSPGFGSYFTDQTALSGASGTNGKIGSLYINSGGMPTQVIVNSGLVLLGVGTFTADNSSSPSNGNGNGGGNGNGNGNGNGGGNTGSGGGSGGGSSGDYNLNKIGDQGGGVPQRVGWREIVPTN